MKKSAIVLIASIMTAAALVGCNEDVDAPLTKRSERVVDIGTIPLEKDFTFHGYRIVNREEQDHFVYVLEKSGVPFAGTYTNYKVPTGKTSYQASLATAIGTNGLDSCTSVEDCKSKLDVLRKSKGELAQLQKQYELEQQTK